MAGLWIAFEGPDGAGKTTAVKSVAEKLRSRLRSWTSRDVIETHHPGQTLLGSHIRSWLKNPEITIDTMTEQLLLVADHSHFYHEVVEKAKKNDAIILADRYNPVSFLAYGIAGELPIDIVHDILTMYTKFPTADCMMLFDLPRDAAMERCAARGKLDKFEKRSGVFDVYRKLELIIKCHNIDVNQVLPSRIINVNGLRAPQDITDEIAAHIIGLVVSTS